MNLNTGNLLALLLAFVVIAQCTGSFKPPFFRVFEAKKSKLVPNKYTIAEFSGVSKNRGKNYNYKTGIFTAPVQGRYSLYSDMCVKQKSNLVSFGIYRKNPKSSYPKVRFAQQFLHRYRCSYISITKKLQKGDQIYVMVALRDNQSPNIITRSVFAGKLNVPEFRATHVEGWRYGHLKKVKFPIVLHNQFKNYKPSDGVYEVPVDGQYQFYCTICAHSSLMFKLIRYRSYAKKREISLGSSRLIGDGCRTLNITDNVNSYDKVFVVLRPKYRNTKIVQSKSFFGGSQIY